jgi:DNA polymerase III subunit epsilon
MDFIAFDVETTGTVAGVDKIVEIGAVKFVNEQVESVFSTLINPGVRIPPSATAVNGISNEMVADKPHIEKLLPALTDFCGECVMVAHNAPFDLNFLLTDYKKYEHPTPRGVVLDTLPISRKVVPGLANYKLGTLVKHFAIPSSDFHRAEEDATYCGRVFLALTRKIFGANPWALENLVALTSRPEFRFPLIKREPKQLQFF